MIDIPELNNNVAMCKDTISLLQSETHQHHINRVTKLKKYKQIKIIPHWKIDEIVIFSILTGTHIGCPK